MASPSNAGQQALQALPGKSFTSKRKISLYKLPDELLQDRSVMKESDEAGLPVLKVDKTGTFQPRRLAFSKDRRNLLVTSRRIRSFKGFVKTATGGKFVTATAKVIPLYSVDRIERGPFSKRFHTLKDTKDEETAAEAAKYLENEPTLCLSIVYRATGTHDLETLDLVVPGLHLYEGLMMALEDLTALAHEEMLRYTKNIQLLYFNWMELGKEWESFMNLSEWISLTEKLQVPVKKSILTTLFKEECEQRKYGGEMLRLPDVAELLEDVKAATVSPAVDPLHRLWRELIETDPVPAVGLNRDNETSVELSLQKDPQAESISAVALLSFIRSQQKNYTATLEEVTDLVHLLNRQMSMEDWSADDRVDSVRDDDRISKSRFMSWLTSDANDILDPEKGRMGADDMTKPLSHYWISTSHDTYLAKLPDSFQGKSAYANFKNGPSAVDLHMYTAALHRGVRCIELDVWDDESLQEPVVGRRISQQSDKKITFRRVLRIIRHFLDHNPYSFPVILKIENHCSTAFQLKVAKQLYEYFGAANLIVTPPEGQPLNTNVYLPSPESARGKILIIGKRPKKAKVGCSIINDDLDEENDGWEVLNPLFQQRVTDFYDNDDESDKEGVVIGFDTKGPIRSKESNVLAQTPAKLLEVALEDAIKAQVEKEELAALKNDLLEKAEVHERLTAQLTQEAGMSPEEVKKRAARAADRQAGDNVRVLQGDREQAGEEKNPKDEGFEVHEILPDLVEGIQDRYAKAAQDAILAAQQVSTSFGKMKEAEKALERAEKDLEMSRQLEKNGVENASRAEAEARAHQEHADMARERVQKVRELLRNSQEHASSAGTVVQTALTEAKISEKRATDAEARASRAQVAAEKDRLRADDETRKEEKMEQEVSELRQECQEATEAAKAARARLDKASAMHDRVIEQIKLIEHSSQYRKEKEQNNAEVSSVRHGGSFLAKHAAKVEERDTSRELIRKASEEKSAAETRLLLLKQKFAEKAQLWKAQASIAAQMRRAADRSTHVAEELAEHAEEEREAAELRHEAREKAVAAVEHRGMQRESTEAQLAEAERAATEATVTAQQSRARANKLAKEIVKIKDHGAFIQAVAKRKWELKQAQNEYDASILAKKEKDAACEEEKCRLDTNSSVYKSAAVDAASEMDRVQIIEVRQQEAIVAYNTTLMLKQQADSAITKSDIAVSVADAKKTAANHAREYKERMDMLIEIPAALATLTLLHSTRFLNWDRSLSASNVCTHSFAQNVLLRMIDSDAENERSVLHAFTRNHLCRVFPPWKTMQSKAHSNYDPVFAWSLGCQLVAMNLHSADENLLVADGRFRQNGSSGYVLKPQYLSDNSSRIEQPQSWAFSVLGGFNLPKVSRRMIRPCVRLSLYEGSAKETRILYKTRTADQNGLNPVFDDSESYVFDVKSPSIAIVVFSVWDKYDDKSEAFVAASSLPVSCLREGYRSISLFDGQNARPGAFAFASLLVKATKR